MRTITVGITLLCMLLLTACDSAETEPGPGTTTSGTAGSGGSAGSGGGTGASGAGEPFVQVVCEALGYDDIQPAQMADAADEEILAKFLEHTENVPTTISASYCAERAAEAPEDYKWVIVPQVSMTLLAYELTGDAHYLDLFVQAFENMRSALTTGPDGYLGWYGKALELFQSPENPDVDVIITSFGVVEMVARFLTLVQCDDELGATYASERTAYLDLLQNHLMPKWDARVNVVDVGETGVIYRTHVDLRVDKGHLTQPHNKHSIILKAFTRMYALTGNDGYLQRAIALGARYKHTLTLVGEHYEWNYWDPAGAWDVHPEEVDQWKHWIGTEHRGGYYSLSLTQAVILYHHGLLITQQDLDRFLETQLEVTWNGDVDNPEWFRVDGSAPGDGAYICDALAPFSPLIEQYLYYGDRQAERLANADHSWQGGPVAAGYLAGKYWVLPHAGGQAMYTAIGDRFLSSPDNQIFVDGVSFEVTGSGYAAPPNPSDWPNMPPEP